MKKLPETARQARIAVLNNSIAELRHELATLEREEREERYGIKAGDFVEWTSGGKKRRGRVLDTNSFGWPMIEVVRRDGTLGRRQEVFHKWKKIAPIEVKQN